MIAILISVVMLGQSDSLATGVKMRMEANKMLMGIHNVPYDVADVMNGTRLSVEQATEIATQRRQREMIQAERERQAFIKDTRTKLKMIVKNWAILDASYDRMISGDVVCPDDMVEGARGQIRQMISLAERINQSNEFPRNVRTAAKNHIKKSEAVLAILEKQSTEATKKQNPGK